MKTMKLNKGLVLTLVIILNGLSIFAQPSFEWVGGINTGTYEWGRTIKTDSNGDVYVYGQCSSSTNDFELGLGNYNIPAASLHLYVAKYSSDKIVIWVKYFGYNATPNDMEIDNAGNIYLTGKFNSTIDLDPSTTGTFNVTANGSNSDIFYSKLDVNGDFLWGFKWGGSSWEEAKSIAVDNSGNMYSTGYFNGSFDFNPGATTQTETSANSNEDVFVTKWDANGNYVWGKRIGEINDDYGNSIELDASGNIVIVGQFSNMVDFNPNAGVFNMLASSNDFFILKLDPNANFIWAKKVGGVGGTAYGHDFAVDSLNNIYVVGEIPTVAIDMDPGAGVFNMTSSGGYDAIVLKLDAAGGFQWAKQFEGGQFSHMRNIDVDDNGNVFCGGEFKDSVDVDPGVGTTWKYSSGGNSASLGAYDAFMVNLASNGDYLWAQSFGTISDQDRFMDIHIANNSTIYSIGHTRNPADLDPGASMVTIQAGAGEDVFVQKLHYCTNTTSSINITECTNYTSPSGNFTWSISGQYQDVISNANGCDSTITVNLTIEDNTAPVANVTSLSNVTGSCSVTSLTAPTATDNCAGTITGTHNATLPITTQGTTVVTWTYNDGNGNTSTQTQNVVITDATAPVADVATLSNVTSECSVTSLTAPTATDNCDGTITGTPDVSFPITASGTTVVTWAYNDGNGNTSVQTQNVVITPIDNGITQNDAITLSANASGYSYQWLDCNNGNQAISGETSQVFVALANGNYGLEISNGTCTVISNCVAVNSVGISKIETSTVQIYPNPTTGDIKVNLEKSYKTVSVKIKNVTGQIVSSANFENVNKFTLQLERASGLYFMEILTNEGMSTIVKVIKN